MTTTNISYTSGIFRQTPEVMRASDTLLRITKLDGALPLGENNRELALAKLNRIWTEAREKLQKNYEEAREFIDINLEDLDEEFESRISDVYSFDLSLDETPSSLEKCIRIFQEDIAKAEVPPAKKTKRGLQGPTFIVRYPKGSENSPENGPEVDSYVLKWTDEQELPSHRVYEALSKVFSEEEIPSYSLGFLVGKAAGINFNRKIHEMINREQMPLTSETCTQLKNNFAEMTKIATSKVGLDRIIPKKEYILVAELIVGENLFDFARYKYPKLTLTQKKKLFNQLGRLGILDVMMGNLDRLAPIGFDKSKKEYMWQDYDANVGNAMIVWAPEKEYEPVLYAIDNGIDNDLIDSSEHKAKYLSFLQSFMSSSQWEQSLAQTIVKSLKRGFKMVDDSSGNVKKIKEQLEVIQKDLDQFAGNALHYGIQEMVYLLQETIIPGWETKAVSLKSYLETTYPELLSSIDERFKFFKFARK